MKLFYSCLNIFFIGVGLFSYTLAKAQMPMPHIINVGGGNTSNLDWSIGEQSSITVYISTNGLSLNTGFLQPNNHLVTAIDDLKFFTFTDEVSIGPNPTSNLLHVKALFKELGNWSIQLLDAKSTILFTQEINQPITHYETDFFLEKFHAGIYYLKINFKPKMGILKSRIYKIVKL